jgi:hypothetical protein
MEKEQYNFVLGVLARVDKKLDLIIELEHDKRDAVQEDEEFQEEFDI